MKEKNVFFGLIAILNSLLMFIFINIFENLLFNNSFLVFCALIIANIVLSLWFFNRSKYNVRTTAQVVNYNSISPRHDNNGIGSVTLTVKYNVNGTPITNSISGIREDFYRIHKGSVLRVGYKTGNPYKIIVIKSQRYKKMCMLVVLELLCLICLIIFTLTN